MHDGGTWSVSGTVLCTVRVVINHNTIFDDERIEIYMHIASFAATISGNNTSFDQNGQNYYTECGSTVSSAYTTSSFEIIDSSVKFIISKYYIDDLGNKVVTESSSNTYPLIVGLQVTYDEGLDEIFIDQISVM